MVSVVLVVDDDPTARYGMRRALERQGHTLLEADSIASAEVQVEKRSPDVILLDVKLASESGLEYLPSLVSRKNPPIVIVVTAHGSERMAVEAIKLGAYDYLPKPFDVDELRILVRNAAEARRLREENQRLRIELAGAGDFGELIGSSKSMARVYSLIEKVAQTDANVLITGESGTGKEVVAREIHARGRAQSGQFVAVNCAAMPEELIESEMFGHEKGAFTGAASQRIGKFEAANRGTLFLDEVGDMSPSTQAKLLRVLEERKFQRLGSNELRTSDARIVSATNKQLEEQVRQNKFREDLYYRLCVVTVGVPPLRERKSDIPALAHVFCQRYASAYKGHPIEISGEAQKRMLDYDWPGNVRQLRNFIERAVVLAERAEITLAEFPPEMVGGRDELQSRPESEVISVSAEVSFKDAKREFERKYIERILNQSSGNITRAAALLGMHRQSLQHKIKELELTKIFSA
ncbi:MAG: sigma-54 dependent transcriptional regulator [Acidobacteriota bacterium]